MGIFDGCLLACDVDGTLMVNGYINPENIKKIEYFISEGGKFSISTGRSVGALSDVLSQIKGISPSVIANGCMIYDYATSSILFENVLSESDHRLAELIINSGVKVGAEIHCGANVYTLKRTEETTLHQVYEKFTAPDCTFDEVTKYKWHKVIYIFDNDNDREKIKELVANEKCNCAFLNTCAVIDRELRNYLEQVPLGVSKAVALKKLCEIQQVKKGCLFAIGDYYNDAEMLKLSDICAVPIDSPEEIKELASYITVKCEDGAVADFINFLESKFNA